MLRSLAIDFNDFPPAAAAKILETIRLHVRAGMRIEELDDLLGPRVAVFNCVSDRVSCDYFTPEPHRYRVSVTVMNDGGLVYVVVTVHPIGDDLYGDDIA